MMINFKILGLILLFSGSAFAQNFNATGLGLGNNFLSYSKGVDAFSINPANLAFNNRTEIKFFSPAIAISNSSISFADYDRYFTKEGNRGFWDSGDKKAVLDLFPEDGLDINTDVDLNVFSMAINNFGFGVDLIINGGASINNLKFAKIFLRELDFTPDYRFEEPNFVKGSFYSVVKYSFSYAQLLKTKLRKFDIDNIAVAAKLSYYAGIGVIEVLDSEILIKRSNTKGTGTDDEVLYRRINLLVRKAYPTDGIKAGGGFGIDLAASAVYDDDWHFSVLLENLFASIKWDVNTEIVEFSDIDSVFILNDDGVDRSTEIDTTRKTGSFSTSLPVNLILGAHYQLFENLALIAQWKQGLSKDFGNKFTPQVGVGAEYRPVSWLPLRSGLTVGGRDGFLFTLGGGVDLGAFEFNLAYAMREALWPTFSNGVYFAFDFKFRL